MKLSIITPLLGDDRRVIRNVISVIRQGHKNSEHLLIHKDTSDGFLRQLLSLNKNLRCIAQKNTGIYEAMNIGLEFFSGDLVMILNSDDFLFDRDAIENIILRFQNCNQVNMCFFALSFVSKNKADSILRSWIPRPFKKQFFTYGLTLPHATMVIRKEAAITLGPYDSEFKIAADFDYILRAIRTKGMVYSTCSKRTVIKELGGISTTYGGGLAASRRDVSRIIDKHSMKTSCVYYLLRYTIKLLQYHLIKKTYNGKWLEPK